MNDGPVVRAQDLVHCYGEVRALKGLSFQLERGEIFGFLGPNGAGKTTTIRILTGLLTPTGGSAQVLGYDVVRERLELKRRIGVVPEASNLYNEMSGWDNLIFMGHIYGLSRRESAERAEALLRQFRLWDARQRRFGGYSRGMKRRLTIAASLVHRPHLLFLDEPTTGLDVASARELRTLITTLNQQGVTIFLTTHLIAEAELLCDRVAILVQGELEVIDTPANLVREAGGTAFLELQMSGPLLSWEAELENLLGIVDLQVLDGRLIIPSRQPHQVLSKLMGFLEDKALTIEAIHQTEVPTLENAFVAITGLDLEVMQQDKEGGRGA
jgi:ABC-2 type transport system ATP-binding protein